MATITIQVPDHLMHLDGQLEADGVALQSLVRYSALQIGERLVAIGQDGDDIAGEELTPLAERLTRLAALVEDVT